MEKTIFKQKATRHIQTADKKMEELELLKNSACSGRASEFQRKMTDIKNKMAELKKANEQLKNASEEQWEKAKGDFTSASDTFIDNYSKFSSFFKSV